MPKTRPQKRGARQPNPGQRITLNPRPVYAAAASPARHDPAAAPNDSPPVAKSVAVRRGAQCSSQSPRRAHRPTWEFLCEAALVLRRHRPHHRRTRAAAVHHPHRLQDQHRRSNRPCWQPTNVGAAARGTRRTILRHHCPNQFLRPLHPLRFWPRRCGHPVRDAVRAGGAVWDRDRHSLRHSHRHRRPRRPGPAHRFRRNRPRRNLGR
jgi:hypothetical protein